MNTSTAIFKPRVIEKNVRHTFTQAELLSLGKELSRAITSARLLEDEAKQIKDSYKARQTEADGKVQTLSADLDAGFQFRRKLCRVVFRPAEKKKDFWPVDQPDAPEPALTEDMTQDDFQQDLLQAESKFECREEIELFPPAGQDRGVMVVGRYGGQWFGALRMQIGGVKIEEKLDSEQRSAKHRIAAIKIGIDKAHGWIAEQYGQDKANGFADRFKAIIEQHKEREE